MRIRLDIPQRVLPRRVLIARNLDISPITDRYAHLLLLESPIRQLDLVREQITSRQRMP